MAESDELLEGEEVAVPASPRTHRESLMHLADHVDRLANTMGLEVGDRPTPKEMAIELDGLSLAMGVLADRLEGPNLSSAIVDALHALRPAPMKGPPVERIERAMEILGDALREER